MNNFVINQLNEKIIKIKSELIKNNIYLGMLLSSINIVFDEKVNTIATDGKSIIINPNFAIKRIEYLKYYLIHELFHIIFMHSYLLSKGFNKVILNIAEDIVINEYIDNEFNFKFEDGIYKEHFPNLVDKDVIKMNSVEVYYEIFDNINPNFVKSIENEIFGENDLVNENGNGGNENKDKISNNKINNECEISNDYKKMLIDEIKEKKKIDDKKLEEKDKIINEIKEIVNRASSFGKLIGNECSNLSNLIDKVIYSKTINWRYLLREELKDISKKKYDYRLLSKKLLNLRKLDVNVANLPSLVNDLSNSRLIILIDSSGSISDEDYSAFLGEIEKIIKSVNVVDGEVVVFDVEIIDKIKIRNGFRNEVINKLKKRVGYGGTNLSEALNYAVKKYKNSYLVLLTDGYVDGFDKNVVKMFKKFIVVLTPNSTDNVFSNSNAKIIRMVFDKNNS
ncbi:MAG: VWA-like domain-containing protein [Candidatus Omnitrophica bacterium]|nr:VWA-like domain-containing protein [Candidatus Omnitrophota bacterium]